MKYVAAEEATKPTQNHISKTVEQIDFKGNLDNRDYSTNIQPFIPFNFSQQVGLWALSLSMLISGRLWQMKHVKKITNSEGICSTP